jgi:TolA-binding protein
VEHEPPRRIGGAVIRPASSLLLAACVVLSACVTTRDEGESMKRDIATLKSELASEQRAGSDARNSGRTRLDDMERRLAALEGTLANLRQADADVGVQLDKVVAEVQTLRGDIEVARKDLEQTTLSVKDILERPPVGLATGTTAPRVDVDKPATIAGVEVPAESKPHYDFAKKLYDDKKFAESAEAFDLWLLRHSSKSPDLVDNSAFWKAESYFNQAAAISDAKAKEKSLKQAILAYQRVIEDPKSEKNDAALHKIGQSFEQLGLKDEAAAFYEEVIAKYPKSPVVADAKKRLKNLGGSKKKKR